MGGSLALSPPVGSHTSSVTLVRATVPMVLASASHFYPRVFWMDASLLLVSLRPVSLSERRLQRFDVKCNWLFDLMTTAPSRRGPEMRKRRSVYRTPGDLENRVCSLSRLQTSRERRLNEACEVR